MRFVAFMLSLLAIIAIAPMASASSPHENRKATPAPLTPDRARTAAASVPPLIARHDLRVDSASDMSINSTNIGADAMPIDQAVGDLDALSRSLRQVQAGLRDNGEQTSLFAVPLAAGDDGIGSPLEIYQPTNASASGQRFRYYRVGPGFRARVQRLDYLVRRGRKSLASNETPRQDGEFLESPGVDAMYELSPVSPLSVPSQTSQTPSLPSAAIVGRVDNQINGRVSTRLGGTPVE